MKYYQSSLWFGLALLALVSFALAQVNRAEQKTESPTTDAHRAHSKVSPDELKWVPAPPKLPPGAQFAVLEGDRSKPGVSYTFRAKVPDGYSVPPHWHSMNENITVIQGTMRLGMGEKFDPAKLRDLPAGSYALLPKGQPHFNLYKGETIIQLHGIAPYDIHYVNPADDPSIKSSGK
jgi:quercetin dioxygenase-like cupin family protein